MGTQNFYDAILPPSELGRRVLAAFINGLKAPPAQHFLGTNEELVDAAITHDEKGVDVYHACAAYGDENKRTGTNVTFVKALWADLDVGDNKPYATLQDAITSIKQFRKELDLPQPYYVASGGGLHVYWPFTRAISADQWHEVAARFAACLNEFGVQHDRSRTQDIASILRVPGTHNYKKETPRPVSVLRDGEVTGAAIILSKLRAYIAQHDVSVLPVRANVPADCNSDLIGAKDYPPSKGERVASRCAVLKEVAETGGDTSYEIWWRAIGVAKHTTAPEETAAHWTRNREETGHEQDDWEKQLGQWATGPTTCEQFAMHSTKCADCRFNGKIKSPIVLGHEDELVAERPAESVAVALNEDEEPWEFDAKWLRATLFKKFKVGVNYRGEFTRQELDPDGNRIQVPFCARYWQVMDRVKQHDGTWQLDIEYTVPQKNNERFLLNSADISAPDKLKAAFGSREIHIYQGKYDVLTTQQLLREFQQQLAVREIETVSHRMMGWCTDRNLLRGELTGEFVLGDMKYAPKKEPVKIQLDKRVPDNLKGGFGAKGELEEWTAFINTVYNRPNAQPYQFVICAAFAAPLIRLCHSPNWHGMPLSLTGDSGGAKTSTAMLATSIYGRPDLTKFAMNANTGDTINSLGLKMGVLNNLPFVADEMSDRDAEFIGNFMYMMTNGMPKDRMLATGDGLVSNSYGWDTIPFITANDAMHERLTEIGNHNIQDATKVRCFEVHLSAERLTATFPDVSPATFTEFLSNNYGTAGQFWIQKIVNNRAAVEEIIRKTRANYMIDDEDGSDTRFYKDLLITVEVAAKLARKFGLIQFDIPAMMDWAKGECKALRETVRVKDWDGVASDFIASLYGRTIVTKKYSLARGRRTPEQPMEALPPNMMPVARKATEDGVMIVTASYFNEWAKARKFSAGFLAQKFRDGGWIIKRDGHSSPHRLSIGSGSTVPRPQALCYEFDYDRAMSIEPFASVGSNVVPLHSGAVTEVVTVEDSVTAESSVSP